MWTVALESPCRSQIVLKRASRTGHDGELEASVLEGVAGVS